jgi:hypothetical protein
VNGDIDTMDSFNLTLSQAWTTINALHTAAEAYENFTEETAAMPSLAKQFRRQAQQARELAELIAKA